MKKTSDSTTKKKGSKKQAKSEKKLKVPFAYKPESGRRRFAAKPPNVNFSP